MTEVRSMRNLDLNHYRNGRRRGLETEVLVHLDGAVVPLKSINVSPSGVFLITDVLPEEGEAFDLLFNLPDGGVPLRVSGSVARVNERHQDPATGRSLTPGIGLEFTDVPDTARRRLARFAEEVAA